MLKYRMVGWIRLHSFFIGVWRRLVACLNGVQEAESSILSTPTKKPLDEPFMGLPKGFLLAVRLRGSRFQPSSRANNADLWNVLCYTDWIMIVYSI